MRQLVNFSKSAMTIWRLCTMSCLHYRLRHPIWKVCVCVVYMYDMQGCAHTLVSITTTRQRNVDLLNLVY